MHSLSCTPRLRARSAGFTLVELAITLLIVTILSAMLLVPLSSREEIRARHATEVLLDEIREALIGYAIIHGRLPCPTREPDTTAAGYGLEDGSCNQSSEGYLPWRELGLPQTDAWGVPRQAGGDPWLGYWRYRVEPNFANPSAPLISATTALSADIDVQDVVTGQRMVADKTLVAIVYSTGPNRTADDENASFEVGGNPRYAYGGPTPSFDDMVAWISHPLLLARLAAAGALK